MNSFGTFEGDAKECGACSKPKDEHVPVLLNKAGVAPDGRRVPESCKGTALLCMDRAQALMAVQDKFKQYQPTTDELATYVRALHPNALAVVPLHRSVAVFEASKDVSMPLPNEFKLFGYRCEGDVEDGLAQPLARAPEGDVLVTTYGVLSWHEPARALVRGDRYGAKLFTGTMMFFEPKDVQGASE